MKSRYHDLMDSHLRKCILFYSKFGYIGVVLREMMAYIELLEEELAKHEATS